MGHYQHTTTIPVSIAPTASDALREALDDFHSEYGNHANPRNGVYARYGSSISLAQAEHLAYNEYNSGEAQTHVIPVCGDNDVEYETYEVKVSVGADKWVKAQQHLSDLKSAQDFFGFDLPPKFSGQAVGLSLGDWKLKTKFTGGSTKGRLIKEYKVMIDGHVIGSNVPRYLIGAVQENFKDAYATQSEATAAIRKVLDGNRVNLDGSKVVGNTVDREFSVICETRREGGGRALASFKREVCKADNTLTIKFAKVKDTARMSSWLVSFDVHS